MYAATAFHHSYEDGGFFCIQGSAHPSQLRECVHVITQEFVKLTQGVDEVFFHVLFSMCSCSFGARTDVVLIITTTGKC